MELSVQPLKSSYEMYNTSNIHFKRFLSYISHWYKFQTSKTHSFSKTSIEEAQDLNISKMIRSLSRKFKRNE